MSISASTEQSAPSDSVDAQAGAGSHVYQFGLSKVIARTFGPSSPSQVVEWCQQCFVRI